jgi:hypothetical protein
MFIDPINARLTRLCQHARGTHRACRWILSLIVLAAATTSGCLQHASVRRPPVDPAPAAGPEMMSAAPAAKRVTVRSVSLNALAREMRACRGDAGCAGPLRQFAGITRVLGYVADPGRRDILILGLADGTQPQTATVLTEDFVVALRHAWGKYDRREGNRIYRSPPGCSIDPRANVLAALHRLDRPLRRAGMTRAYRQRWEEIGRQPQDTRVFGVPRDTHFSAVMIAGDYLLKTAAEHPIVGTTGEVECLMGRRLRCMREALRAGHAPDLAPSFNRFWFASGAVRYVTDPGVALLREVPVKLLTEAELFDARGRRHSEGHSDRLAAEYAAEFTRAFPGIAARHAAYARLEQLYRWVFLTHLLHKAFERSPAGSALRYWLEEYPLPRTAVAATRPGVATVREEEYTAEGGRRGIYRSMTCGGVSIDASAARPMQGWVHQASLPALRKEALEARPPVDVVSWDLHLPEALEQALLHD